MNFVLKSRNSQIFYLTNSTTFYFASIIIIIVNLFNVDKKAYK